MNQLSVSPLILKDLRLNLKTFLVLSKPSVTGEDVSFETNQSGAHHIPEQI